jgi:hypothetical protein
MGVTMQIVDFILAMDWLEREGVEDEADCE